MVPAALLLTLRTAALAQQPVAAATPVVFDRVTVVDVEHGTLKPSQRVAIVGNRIHAIGAPSAVPIPMGARIVDASGKYLIPGLWDMHVHPGGFVDIAYPLFIANGVTGVRDAGSSVPLATLGRWKQEIAAGQRVGPRLIVSGQSIDGPAVCSSGEPHHICVTTPSEARLVVDLFKTAGADMIKTYGLSREMHLAVAAEARRIGIPFGGHSWNVPGLELSDSGASILDHSAWLNPEVCGAGHDPGISEAVSDTACATAGQHLRSNGTWVVLNAPAGGGAAMTVFRERTIELWRRYLPTKWFDKLHGVFASQPSQAYPPARPVATSTAGWAAAVTLPDSGQRADTLEAKERGIL